MEIKTAAYRADQKKIIKIVYVPSRHLFSYKEALNEANRLIESALRIPKI